MEILNEISIYLQQGQSIKVRELTINAIEKNYTYEEILSTLLDSMSQIGIKFKNNDVFVPEVLIAARAFNSALDVIKPLIDPKDRKYIGKVVIGTVEGDLHDIGKNLVAILCRGAGFEVIDLGVNVSAEKFVRAVEDNSPDILAMSALLTTTMPKIKKTIDLLESQKLRDNVFIVIGGAPVTSNYAKEIGADGYAIDAGNAAELLLNYITLCD